MDWPIGRRREVDTISYLLTGCCSGKTCFISSSGRLVISQRTMRIWKQLQCRSLCIRRTHFPQAQHCLAYRYSIIISMCSDDRTWPAVPNFAAKTHHVMYTGVKYSLRTPLLIRNLNSDTFFPRAATSWNGFRRWRFLDNYNLSTFVSGVNRYLFYIVLTFIKYSPQ